MGIILSVVVVFLLVTVFLPWRNLLAINDLQKDVRALRGEIKRLEGAAYEPVLSGRKEGSAASVPEVLFDQKDKPIDQKRPVWNERDIYKSVPVENIPEVEKIHPTVSFVGPDKNGPSLQKPSFEQYFAAKLPVWVGALSLMCAAFFLVKYSIDLGWLNPTVRISLGALFGAGLLWTGRWLMPRTQIANSGRIALALIGAGIVTLYFSIYAARELYDLLSPVIAFSALCVVTATAVVLSLRHGPVIALFGLLGGLMTPVLVGSDEANAVMLFGYLSLLFGALFSIIVRQGWWSLAVLALLGTFAWLFVWFGGAFTLADAKIAVGFGFIIAVLTLIITGMKAHKGVVSEGAHTTINFLNLTAFVGAAAAVFTMAWLATLSMFDWSVLILLGAGLMVMTWFKPSVYKIPLYAMLGGSLFLYYFWNEAETLGGVLMVLSALFAVYAGGGQWLMRHTNDPRPFVYVKCAAAFFIYVLAYYTEAFGATIAVKVPFFWGALALGFAGYSIFQAARVRQYYHADEMIRDRMLAAYALTVSSFIVIGAFIELPWEYMRLAIALQVAATAFVFVRYKFAFLERILGLLMTMIFAFSWKLFYAFGNLIMSALVSGKNRLVYEMGDFLFLAGPALIIAAALYYLLKNNSVQQRLFDLMSCFVLFVLGASAYILIGISYQDHYAAIFTVPASFTLRGIVTIVIAVLGCVLYGLSRLDGYQKFASWAYILFSLAAFRYVYFEALLHNLYWDKGQNVGDVFLLNGLTITFGMGCVFWLMFARVTMNPLVRNFAGIMAFSFLFAFISYSVRQYFHGGDLSMDMLRMAPAELYSYSAVWIISGIALLGAGIVLRNRALRMAALAFILLAVLKVFLYDAAALTGLYRIFSFLGLGVSLIGLSVFYTRFVSRTET